MPTAAHWPEVELAGTHMHSLISTANKRQERLPRLFLPPRWSFSSRSSPDLFPSLTRQLSLHLLTFILPSTSTARQVLPVAPTLRAFFLFLNTCSFALLIHSSTTPLLFFTQIPSQCQEQDGNPLEDPSPRRLISRAKMCTLCRAMA